MPKDGDKPASPAAAIEEAIRTARKKQLNFVMMRADKGVVLATHPTKGLTSLIAECKEQGGQVAMTMCGTMVAEGNVTILNADIDDIPQALPRLAKRHFKELGLTKFKLLVRLPSGGEIDTDAEDGAEMKTVAPGIEAPAVDAEALKGELTERIKALVPQVKDAVAAALEGAETLGRGLKAAAEEMARGGLDRARQLVDAVEAGLRKAKGAAEAAGAAAAKDGLLKEFNELKGDLERLVQEAASNVAGKARQLAAMFATEIERDAKKAGGVLSLLKTFVPAEIARLQPQPAETGDAAVPNVGGGEGGEFLPNEEGIGSRIKGAMQKVKEVLTGKSGKHDDSAETTGGTGGTGGTGAEGTGASGGSGSGIAEKVVEVVKDLVAEGMGKLRDTAMVAELKKLSPEAAKAAEDAIAAFDKVLDGAEVTPELLAKAAGDLATASKLTSDMTAALDAAQKLPAGPAREAAVKEAQKNLKAAQEAEAKAAAYDTAARGRQLLNDTLTTGALAPGAAKAYSPAAAEGLVKGIGRDPTLAGQTLDMAKGSPHHEALAKNLNKVIDLKETGFRTPTGTTYFLPEASADYARNLMANGAVMGDEYFARMPDYMASGRQFEPDPMGDTGATTWPEIAQRRSMKVGKAMLDADGNIKVDSDDAKKALGDMLFNRRVLANSTPAQSAHMLKTAAFFRDPDNARKGSDLLKAIPEPNNDTSKAIINRAHGRADTDPATKGDAQAAVMASMMKSLDQGPIGSCFATAPARRMRETQPLDAMGQLTQIAANGTYKPPFGPEVPAVTNVPPNEDPLMRSWEYSLATSTARQTNSQEQRLLDGAMKGGVGTLSAALLAKAMEGSSGLGAVDLAKKTLEETGKATIRASKLAADLKASIELVYDAKATLDATSSDGHSTGGRYVMKIKGESGDAATLDTKQKFIDGMTRLALTSLGIDPAAPEAQTVRDHVASDTFINAVCPETTYSDGSKVKYVPWNMPGGGQTTPATRTLFGDTLKDKEMTPRVTGSPPPKEGERTTRVLTDLLENFRGVTGEMVTINTGGIHGFNALPNHPSLAALKGKDAKETGEKVKANLTDKGTELKGRKLPADVAAQMFDKALKAQIGREPDAEVKALLETGARDHRPAAEMTSAELAKAIRDATGPANDKRADKAAETWRLAEVAGGRTPSPDKIAEKKTGNKDAFAKSIDDAAKTEMMQFLGTPEFVIADSNWGGPLNHSYIIVAPDPETGEPLLWKKVVPPGNLVKMERKWVDTNWSAVQ